MATPNYYTINALSYYTINGYFEDEDGNEVIRDSYDFREIMEDIMNYGNFKKSFPIDKMGLYDINFKAEKICADENYHIFGKGNNYTTEIVVTNTICLRDGYYSGAVLDYEISVKTYEGNKFCLSDYEDYDSMIDDIMTDMRDYVDYYGHNFKWNSGTFKMQKKNIRKWISNILDNEMRKAEDFCKVNCEDELERVATFSNGETIYRKVND